MGSRVMLPPTFFKSALFIIAGTVYGSCQRQPTTLWFDAQFATDYVANDCKVKEQLGTPCRWRPQLYVSAFKDQLDEAFAIDTACHGLPSKPALRKMNGSFPLN